MAWRLVAASAVALALIPATASASMGLRVVLPAPGGVTVTTVKETVRGPARMPKRLRLLPQKVRSLPSSVRVMYARRTVRKRKSTTYLLTLIAINVASRSATASGDTPPEPRSDLLSSSGGEKLSDFATYYLFFGGPLAAEEVQKYSKQGDLYVSGDMFSASNPQAPAAPDLWSGARDTLDGNHDGKLDPSVDTGHYDDGHAFGWSIKSNADERKTWGELAKSGFDSLEAQLEQNLNDDINGNGQIDQPGSSPGTQINTQVGQPTVTGGP
jgi:hypothetical protein